LPKLLPDTSGLTPRLLELFLHLGQMRGLLLPPLLKGLKLLSGILELPLNLGYPRFMLLSSTLGLLKLGHRPLNGCPLLGRLGLRFLQGLL
jgi:hypothetical protein